MKTKRGLYIRLIKGFRFPEPIFFQKSLTKEFKYLSDFSKMKSKIELMGKSKNEIIINIGKLKPVRKQNSKYDQFWTPFQYSLTNPTDLGLRVYPFQIVPFCQTFTPIYIQRQLLENALNTKFEFIHPQYQIRLYPAGSGSVHLILYLKLPPNINLCKLLNSVLKFRWLNAPFLMIGELKRCVLDTNTNVIVWKTNSPEMNFFEWTKYIGNRILKQISTHQEDREIRDYMAVINLQGKFQTQDVRCELERRKGNIGFFERYNDDVICLNKRPFLFIYVDNGLRKLREIRKLNKRQLIFYGRKRLRNHLINVAELGYLSSYLLKVYNGVISGIFGENLDLRIIHTLGKIVYIPSYFDHIKCSSYISDCWKRIYTYLLINSRIDPNFINTLEAKLEQLKQSFPDKEPHINELLRNLSTLTPLILEGFRFLQSQI